MKKIHKIIIILLFIFCLSGCYNYEEINNYAIVSGISIDQNKEDNSKYDVGIQIMNAKKDEEADNSVQGTIYQSKIVVESFDRESNNPSNPMLDDGMIAVTYNGSNWVKADRTNINNSW